MIEVLTDNHYDRIMDLFESVEHEITIVSPFLSMTMAQKLCEIVKQKSIQCRFITRFYLEDMFAKANSIDALELMMNSGIVVYAVKGLHTKLYLFDNSDSVVGSANFTSGGFVANVELSLLASNEDKLMKSLRDYCDTMIAQIEKNAEGRVTETMIADARKRYQSLLDGKKDSSSKTLSFHMYGAELERNKISTTDALIKEVQSGVGNDIMQSVFSDHREEVKLDHTIWLKFDGEGDDRINPHEGFPMVRVNLDGKQVYIQNYPFGIGAISDGDEVYLAAITTDTKGKNQPVIVGRGTFRGFTGENVVRKEWLKQTAWMERFPFYCITDNVKIIDADVSCGIPLSNLWDVLGSDTYMASYGRNETYIEVSRKHYQKAHIRLSGNAKKYLDKKLDELESQYGFIEYDSE